MGVPPVIIQIFMGFSLNHPAIGGSNRKAPPGPHQGIARWPPDSGDPTGRPRTWLGTLGTEEMGVGDPQKSQNGWFIRENPMKRWMMIWG